MPGCLLRTRLKRSSALRWPSCSRKAPKICSRLLDRLPPAGRRPEMSGSGRANYQELIGRERRPAAAGGRRVRVLDGEAAAGDGVHEVDLGALEIADADRINEQLHAVRLEHLVARALSVFFDHQAVLEARAAAALHEHAKAAAAFVFFDH